ncbi:craniofacial development protein 2-like [Leguminivora glycinivorella]|uniref:craniofacial development protein 2-like n=1 Tax=Leguminivora glycinivorella TaxID=1035111 RepID=UPI00200E64A1|nr:craniofacial development protein 2-like [Leguminivora glycinivorella]
MRKSNTRASPLSDVDANKAINEKHARAFPKSDARDKNRRSHLKTNDKLRLATWNLGTMTGRSQELSEILKTREINACCIQETKWKGSKSRDIGNGYQFVYHGTDTRRNGVGVVLDNHLKQRIINVDRKSDRLIAIKLAMDNQQPMNIISVYAPQTGCSEQEKQDFWEDFDEVMQNIPPTEYIHIGGDLNGHVGEGNDLNYDAHGGYGLGPINQQGIDILNFTTKHSLKIVNTHFRKKAEHLITYKCSNHKTQIDFIVTSSNSLKLYKDCKVIPGNALTSQHRLLVAVMTLPKPIKMHIDRSESIKWKELHTPKGSQFLEWAANYVIEDMEENKSGSQMWDDFQHICLKNAKASLGISRGGLRLNKETSWWNESVKDLIKAKRKAFKLWQKSSLEEDRLEYKNHKKIARSAVAQSIAKSREDFYDKLEQAETENAIYKIARQRYRSTLDIKTNKYIKDTQGRLLTANKDINNRWKEYYEQLMNEEYPNALMLHELATQGPIYCITVEEVKKALTKMKYHKATGPDQIPADIWKKTDQTALPWLTKLFNCIIKDGKIPEGWRNSTLCPIYKQKAILHSVAITEE